VLLVEPDQHAREGLHRAYDGEWDLEIVGEASSVVEALAELDRLSPDARRRALGPAAGGNTMPTSNA
jgi:YesN/AraC family two-component response regulator